MIMFFYKMKNMLFFYKLNIPVITPKTAFVLSHRCIHFITVIIYASKI